MAAAPFVLAVGSAEAAPVGDHWVDNLGDGTTASDFDGNSSSDCTSEAFLSGDYDLWHFVVNQASDPSTIVTWNEANSVWADPSSVTVVDVTSQYGPDTAGDGTKLLWIATTPPGATLVEGYLDYDGTAGREVLSHACGRTEPPPSIEIDPDVRYEQSYEWTLDKTVDWAVNPTGGYDLDYTIVADRSEVPSIVPGSLHVTGTILLTPPTLELTDLTVAFTQGTYVLDCAVDLAALQYDCTLDVTRVQTDPATGRPTGTGTLSALAAYAGGTLTDTTEAPFDGVAPTTVYAETATISDDNATPDDPSDDRSTTEDTLTYAVFWMPSGSACVSRTNTATLWIDDPAPGMEDPSDTVTVAWCPPLPGRTIGYWGNNTGAPVVVANIGALKTMYPNALATVPTFTSPSSVRTFMQSANCSGTCQSMFAAQFLATAMNARDAAFAAQSLWFDGDCVTVSALLVEADAGATGATKTWYAAYAAALDAINNSRQTSCLTVTE